MLIINSIREEAEAEPFDKPLTAVFNDTLDFTFQRTAVALIKLFFYLRMKFLDLRRVSCLFSSGTAKYKTMLRKLYTVSMLVSLLEIVRKTTTASEIQLNVPLDSENASRGLNVLGMLNTETQLAMESVYHARRNEFELVCAQFAEIPPVQVRPERRRTAFPSIAPWEVA
jgi:hypothetical protein